MRRGKRRALLAGVVAAFATVLAGRWAVGLFTSSELIHFSVNFPSTPGAEVAPREKIGGPWTRLDPAEWNGYPPGGLLAWGREGRIVVDLRAQGGIKRAVQPWKIGLSSHWIRNVGTRPRRIRIELEACGIPVEYRTFERDWDPARHRTTRSIAPGGSFNLDWVLEVPPALRSRPVVCDGGVRVTDADSAQLLSFLPVRIVGPDAPAGCPCHKVEG